MSIWTFDWLIKEKHEGRHNLTVSLKYGEENFQNTLSKQMFIDVNCLN